MSIHKLPQHLINKLKAGEIVERPLSVVKELMENALDAGATSLVLKIKDGGNTLISVQDDGNGISQEDLELTIASYATSKITDENDLQNIYTYGFRGEALASISQVSKFTLQTKTSQDIIGHELTKISNETYQKKIPMDIDHGTIVRVEDLFFNTPARFKFLKTSATEYKYIQDFFLDFALINFDKGFILYKDDKLVYDLKPCDSLYDRIWQIFKDSRQKNIKIVENKNQDMSIYGLITDASLSFLNQDYIKIFVNKRLVNDRIIKKSIIESYYRQLPQGEHPLAVLFLDVKPTIVDVNVHPRKTEVKFLDPGSIFNFVKNSISQVLAQDKSSAGEIRGLQFQQNRINYNKSSAIGLDLNFTTNISTSQSTEDTYIKSDNNDYKIIGQIFDSYIVLESGEDMLLVDQHALAERITFEQIRQDITAQTEVLLQPLIISISKALDIDDKISQLKSIGFDVDVFGPDKIIFYAMPKALVDNIQDLQTLIDKIISMEVISLQTILDKIYADQACKASIKAGQKLSIPEMHRLVQDGIQYIKGMWVCQHGRPGMIRLHRSDIGKLFDRQA